ncbi:helix-turn-helix domain-containing protein [Methylobacterium sp. W2]|uniref:GlxA family transcriptional regulator n=1 Tax=Methylobacterium sp. W2 TaxID=2598107 RepID=UPI001D0C25BD|nr:helix-turn-helix domain-containing protein [Methylobacterium sp. W2]MCC0807822.1 helix-turn-helix domain-containing protein [Methylobacterium sp. W2]
MLTIGVLAIPDLKLMSLSAMAVFQVANNAAGEPVYDLRLISESGGLVQTNAGFSVMTEPPGEAAFDTLIVSAFTGASAASPALLAFVRRAAGQARRVASFCRGSFVLAEAGLLAGRQVTAHWGDNAELGSRFPDLRVETDQLYVRDGSVWTSAGMTASIDMALALVEDDLGPTVARDVARRMLLERRRFGGQQQASTLLDLQPKSDRIQRAFEFVRANLRETLSVARLADVARLSPRQFSRAVQAEFGLSPAKVIERLRADAARVLLLRSRHSLDIVAAESGFTDRERMRRAFMRIYGRTPQEIRHGALRDRRAA